MKKFLLSFVFFVFTFALLFATSGDTLIINVKVPAVSPEFKITGTLESDYITNIVPGSQAGAAVIGQVPDISQEDVTIYCAIAQNNLKKVRYRAAVDLGISASTFKLDNDNETLPPTITKTGIYSGSGPVVTWDNTNKVFRCDYQNGKPVSNYEVGRFTVVWAADESLAEGDYVATITLTYTIV